MRSAVRICPDPPIVKGCGRIIDGAIAQLGERLPCTQEVNGSIPFGSTINSAIAESSELSICLEVVEMLSSGLCARTVL